MIAWMHSIVHILLSCPYAICVAGTKHWAYRSLELTRYCSPVRLKTKRCTRIHTVNRLSKLTSRPTQYRQKLIYSQNYLSFNLHTSVFKFSWKFACPWWVMFKVTLGMIAPAVAVSAGLSTDFCQKIRTQQLIRVYSKRHLAMSWYVHNNN